MGPVKPEGYENISIHADNGQGCFLIERLPCPGGNRISIRVGKVAVYFAANEAVQVVEAIDALLGGHDSKVRL